MENLYMLLLVCFIICFIIIKTFSISYPSNGFSSV